MVTQGAGPGAHVIFELEVGADGWPPVSAERVWAHDLGDDRFRIDNAPWFVRNVAVGDVVRATAPDANSHPVFVELLEPSDHATIRIVCFRGGPLAGDLQRVVDAFTSLGVWVEGVGQYGLVALDLPPDVDLAAINRRLQDGVRNGSWEYEEGRVSPAWVAANQAETSVTTAPREQSWWRRRR